MVVLRFVFALFLLFVCGPASATEVQQNALSVRVVVAGDGATTLALEQHLVTLLSERHVQLELRRELEIRGQDVLNRPAHEETILANIWLDVTQESRALLYIKNARSDRFLVRTLPLENGYDELGRESLANIVESAIDVLLQGGEIGVTREEAEKQVAAQAPAPPDPPPAAAESTKITSNKRETSEESPLSPAIFAGVTGDLTARSVARLSLRMGASLSGVRTARFTWFSSLEGGYAWSSPLESNDVRLEFETLGGRWVTGLRLAGGHIGWRLGLGGGLEAMRVTAEVKDPSLRVTSSLWVLTPLLSAMTSLDLALSERWFGVLSIGGDVALTTHDFEVVRGETAESLLSPWRVRPSSQLGIGFFLGK